MNDNGNINIIGIIFHAFYSALNMFTQVIGLTPLQFLFGAGCIFALVLVWSGVQGARGHTKFTFEEEGE